MITVFDDPLISRPICFINFAEITLSAEPESTIKDILIPLTIVSQYKAVDWE